MASQWEIVGKQSRKTKIQGNPTNKQSKKTIAENMPRIEVASPVKESETIYDAFREKSAPRQEQIVKEPAKSESPSSKKSNQQKRTKKPQGDNKKKQKSPSLEEAIANIDSRELEAVLARDHVTFPDSPDVWLKDLASIINLRLDKVPEEDPVFEGKPPNYPVCLLEKNLKKLLVETMLNSKDEILLHFLDHCIASMVQDISKSISTYGYRIFIQLLAHERPDIVILSLKKQSELLQSHQSRPLRSLSVMWALGQAGTYSLANGIKVWLQVMCPVLSSNNRALSPYAVTYLESLFSHHKDIKTAYGTIDIQDFFPLQDLIIGGSSSLSGVLNKKLTMLYPKIKMIAYGSHPERSLRLMFPSFLARASPKTSKAMKSEVLNCLTDCLQTDPHCFSVWRQMYTKRLQESAVLMQHLLNNWESVSGSLDLKLLKGNIQAFSITNDELAKKKKVPTATLR